MISISDFDFVTHASYREIKERIQKPRTEFAKAHIDSNIKIIRSNPFTQKTIDFLLNEGWACMQSFMSGCSDEKKQIKLNEELTTQGDIYDYYERDIHLIHELHHAWYGRFKINGWLECLSDKMAASNEFESRLINEYLSRINRSNPLILRAAVEGFGLKPQIYDLASKKAFEYNPKIKQSRLAQRNPELLNTILMDGPDNHFYKQKLERLLKESPNEFWKQLEDSSEILVQRRKSFLLENKIISKSPFGNYAFVSLDESGKETKIGPCIWVYEDFYLANKQEAIKYQKYIGEKDFKLVRIQEVK